MNFILTKSELEGEIQKIIQTLKKGLLFTTRWSGFAKKSWRITGRESGWKFSGKFPQKYDSLKITSNIRNPTSFSIITCFGMSWSFPIRTKV